MRIDPLTGFVPYIYSLIVVAAFALCIGHPGLISNVGERRPSSEGLTSTEVVHEK